MYYLLSVVLGAMLACGLMAGQAEALEVGQAAPAFELNYGDSKVLYSSDIANNVMVMTFESRETKDINNPFKDILLEAFPPDERLRRTISLVPVIDCFAYPWPIKGFCVRGVQDNARKLNLQLYVDKTGKMFQDYGATSDTSTVVIIDRSATVRYVHSGRIADEEIAGLIELIRTLAAAP